VLRRNYLIGLVILIFWGAMTTILLRREVLIPRAQPSTAAIPADERQPQDTWMGIYVKNELGTEDRVGYVHLTSTPGEQSGDTGVRYGMTLRLASTVLSMPTELLLDGNAWVADGKGLSDFDFRVQDFGAYVLRAKGRIEDGAATLDVETAGETFPMTFPVGEDMLVQGGFGATTLNMPSLEIGDAVLIDAFDPVTLTKGTARVECVGTDVLKFDGHEVVTKVLETELGGMTTKTWVSLDNEVMRVESPVGLVLTRVSQQEALRSLDSSAGVELIHTVAVRPSGQAPFRGATEMRYRVSGGVDGMTIPTDDVQRSLDGGEYWNVVPAPPAGPITPVDLAEFKEFLGRDSFVQTGHKRITKLAREIVGNETDPWRKAQLIYTWVFENIEKSPVLSVPSALDVLESREGDCNEHAVLYAALARSEGVPTRIAVGLVWSADLSGFYYHAWPEVYAGRWIPVDPTLGQPVADATHIKLAEGSVVQWMRLAPFLGQVGIDVMDVR